MCAIVLWSPDVVILPVTAPSADIVIVLVPVADVDTGGFSSDPVNFTEDVAALEVGEAWAGIAGAVGKTCTGSVLAVGDTLTGSSRLLHALSVATTESATSGRIICDLMDIIFFLSFSG